VEIWKKKGADEKRKPRVIPPREIKNGICPDCHQKFRPNVWL